MLNHLKKHAEQSFATFEDCPHIQHGLHHHREYWVAVPEELPDAGFVASATNRSHQQTISPQHAANVILDVDQLALEKVPVRQK